VALWRILRKHSLIRTADEERRILFTQSERVPCRTLFSQNIFRALFASMTLDPRVRAIHVQFMTGGNTNIDLVYNHERKLIQIHQKWIDFEKSHNDASCDAFLMRDIGSTKDGLFSCDHIVDDLFELIVGALRNDLSISPMQSWTLRRAARQLVHRMPRMVRLTETATPNQLKLTWIGNESSCISKTFAKNMRYIAILHKMSTCPINGQILCNIAGKCIRNLNFLTQVLIQ
jgi:hypothetical protein